MTKNFPRVSVIIIAESWNSFLEESLPKYKDLDYSDFEVLVITTEKIVLEGLTPFASKGRTSLTCLPAGRYFGFRGFDPIRFKFITSPETKNLPAKKRDLGAKLAKGEILAFIDDDAFPSKDWLKEAIKHFENKDICAVGGPGVTPSDSSNLEKASGWVSASPFGGFGASQRFIPQKQKYVDDLPSMNLIVRKEDFNVIGGFDSAFYPGEDTKLCLDLTKKLGKKIIYDPKVLVYHHKRPLFKKHLKQNGRYGFHRGYFARTMGGNSRKVWYFMPAIFSIGIILGASLLILNLPALSEAEGKFEILNQYQIFNISITKITTNIYFSVLVFYVVLLTFNSLWVFGKSKSVLISLLTIPGVFLTHFWYGLKFVQGFFSKKTVDTYGRA